MAFFFGDGFDLYAAATDAVNGYWDTGSGGTALGAGRFSGSRAIVSNGNQSATAAMFQKSSGANDAVHHFSVSVQQTVALTGTNVYWWLTLSDGATAQCSVVFRSDGAILLTAGASNGATLATYAGALTAISTWYQFEIEVVVNNTTGSIAVRKNGNVSNDFSLGSLNTRATANNYANRLGVGFGNAASNLYMDDLLWRSDASAVAWIGDVRCFTRMPAADASAAWSRNGATFQMQPYFGTTSTVTLSSGSGRYTLFTSQGGTIGSVVVNLLAGYTGNLKCAIFAYSAGNPGAVLQAATAAVANPVTGANTFTFSPPVSIAKGSQFFVGICSDTAVTNGTAVGFVAPYNLNGWIGAVTYASFPVANPTGLSANPAQPVFPVVTPGANADMVADVAEDGAVSYVLSSTVSQSDLYGISAIGSTPSTIVGVTTRAYCQKSDAGTRNVAVQLQSGATNVQSASTALNTTWGHIYRVDLTDPATGAAWTATGVNNCQVGVVVTA